MNQLRLCLFGEVLFDAFPDGRRVLGGAPFNVAWHLSAFGAAPQLISAVGTDADGDSIRASMASWGMTTAGLQTAPGRPTGLVEVSLVAGEPQYAIVPDSAYDFIQVPEATVGCGILYHGTLATRQPVSAATLRHLKAAGPDLVYLDVNLRAPWWSTDAVWAMLTDAAWIKLNQHELVILSGAAEGARPLVDQARAFLERHALAGLLVTLGAAGALGVAADGRAVRVDPTPALEVVDTVGAGDAFAAVSILGILRGWPLEQMLERAQAFAARIVTQRGATAADPALYAGFRRDWGLD